MLLQKLILLMKMFQKLKEKRKRKIIETLIKLLESTI